MTRRLDCYHSIRVQSLQAYCSHTFRHVLLSHLLYPLLCQCLTICLLTLQIPCLASQNWPPRNPKQCVPQKLAKGEKRKTPSPKDDTPVVEPEAPVAPRQKGISFNQPVSQPHVLPVPVQGKGKKVLEEPLTPQRGRSVAPSPCRWIQLPLSIGTSISH